MSQDLAFALGSNVLLFLLVFGLSASINTSDFRKRFNEPTAICVGLCCQFFLLPFIGFVVVKVAQLRPIVGIPLLVVTSSPGGSYSNWWCSLFNADLPLSIAMTTASTFLALGFLPLNLLLYVRLEYGESVSLDWVRLLIPIVVVASAIAAGLIFSHNASAWLRNVANKFGNIAGVGLILFSAAIARGSWHGKGPGFYAIVASPCFIGVILAFAIASVPRLAIQGPKRLSVAVECCYQNVGIAQAVALTLFKKDERAQALIVPLFYGFVEAIIIGAVCLVTWKVGLTLAPASDPLWKVLFSNYQDEADVEDREDSQRQSLEQRAVEVEISEPAS